MSTSAPQTRSVIVEREIAHPPEKLWRALTQPHLIAEWLMRNDFVPSLGHRFKLHGDWGGVLDCEVLAIELNRTLSYSWDLAHEEAAFSLKSVVTFTLSPPPKGTLLRMEQVGFRPDQKLAYGGARSGWPRFFDKLEELLAKAE
ncbi:SRPBCC family protein [Bosea sp. NPDC055594]